MSDLTRRTFLGTMAVAAGTSALPKSMERGDLSFQNNVPDSLLSGKELPISNGIENVGTKPSRMRIGFNAGTYEAIDLSAWIAGNPVDVLVTNFNRQASLFEKFPRNDVFIWRINSESNGAII